MAADPHSTPSSSSPDSPPPVNLRSSPERSGNSNGDQPAALPPLATENHSLTKATQSSRSPFVDRAASHTQPGSPREPNAQGPVPRVMILFVAIVVMSVGIVTGNFWIGIAGSIVALLISAQILWVPVRLLLTDLIPEQERVILFGSLLGGLALLGFLKLTGAFERLGQFLGQIGWDAIGALGEVLGAVGQILIAILAVYVAWRQYIISRDLTIQQNLITQQQTIDSYFQGVSELVLDEEGLLEDWPQERAIAEGRTAAIFSSVDASGKAKIIRFLSRAQLLTPLKRDRRLGRAILDGAGGYEEDRVNGVRVIDLGVMLAGADLSGTDLRWTDLSEANLIRANLSYCDLVKANFSRTILFDAKLRYTDLNSTRFFYGKATEASPRSRIEPPDYRTGKHTGAVIENADFTGATQMSEEQRYYCCAWGGEQTRSTIPGGCEGIPNKLGR
ncbi:pentapeptide repeat-containing protein [Leptodesmis sichuanensis]|uniref:pentapeptide repeat-containing protein n=1 Tax=Leptodesmis sichuanensis TaxID=2906798 RepID=UPI001F290DFE|nr:pentapeptide repeat-containing protein [Leptodesmis sichuanensis]UIE37618.1 pentapeptide repeat-containing protein [Leptodesmis sichuanensis A121]